MVKGVTGVTGKTINASEHELPRLTPSDVFAIPTDTISTWTSHSWQNTVGVTQHLAWKQKS